MIPCDNCFDPNRICVPGRGNSNAEIMFVGEAPGKDEVKAKPPTCWIGKAGKELENYITMVSRVVMDICYLTNLVKCHPPNDRDPTKKEIESCSKILEQEIVTVNPRIIAALGSHSVKYFLGDDVTLERIHGVPIERDGRVILPMYHPAAGLHNSTLMVQILYDFEVLGRLARENIAIGAVGDKYPECEYRLARDESTVREYLKRSSVIAIDTESVKDGSKPWRGKVEPWCISMSAREGTGLVVMVRDIGLIKIVGEKLADNNVLTLIHNIMYDKPILDEIGIIPASVKCTMVMAYLTQSLPQGLKDLAYRLCGMEMKSYEEMVRGPSRENALGYLLDVGEEVWPDPEPELVWEKGVPRVKKGWALHKRTNKILRDLAKDDMVDVRERWNNIEDRLRKPAEDKFGLMPIGDLSEIPLEDAVKYTARDADGTLRVYPSLQEILGGMNIDAN